jgi:hypothetical protein
MASQMIQKLESLMAVLTALQPHDHIVRRELDAAAGHIRTAVFHIKQKERLTKAVNTHRGNNFSQHP